MGFRVSGLGFKNGARVSGLGFGLRFDRGCGCFGLRVETHDGLVMW